MSYIVRKRGGNSKSYHITDNSSRFFYQLIPKNGTMAASPREVIALHAARAQSPFWVSIFPILRILPLPLLFPPLLSPCDISDLSLGDIRCL